MQIIAAVSRELLRECQYLIALSYTVGGDFMFSRSVRE